MNLPRSIIERVRREFERDALEEVLGILSTYGDPQQGLGHERVLTDILALAQGDKAQVKELVERANRDYRDIIFWAEYPQESKLDTPEKKEKFNRMLEKLGAAWRVPEDKKGG